MKYIQKGTRISAKHIKSEKVMCYKVVEERETRLLRLLNLQSHYLMNGFKAKNEDDIIEYIERTLECTILSIQYD